MPGMEWILDTLLVVLLTATLFHAVRLERALGVLKRDRSALEALVASFNASTRAAEAGIEHLRTASEGSGRQIQRQIEVATTLKDDLTFLVQRGEGLADRLDEGIRAARPALGGHSAARMAYESQPGLESYDLSQSDLSASDMYSSDMPPTHLPHRGVSPSGMPRSGADASGAYPSGAYPSGADPSGGTSGAPSPTLSQAALSHAGMPNFVPTPRGEPKVRSQAERDLLKALRMAR
jgi:hypothetical protein